MMLRMLRQTKGTALTVSDTEMLQAGRELASLEGIFAAPEGAATVIGARKLAASGWIKPEETVVLFNTGLDTNIPRRGSARCSLSRALRCVLGVCAGCFELSARLVWLG